jgi:hypothetical protein
MVGLPSLGLGEMVMMFAAAGGDVVHGGCGCERLGEWCCRGFGRVVLPWIGCMVGVLKKNILKKIIL